MQAEAKAGCSSQAIVDQTDFLTRLAWFNIVKTTAIMVVLYVGQLLINRDAEDLIITPVKRMTKYVSFLGPCWRTPDFATHTRRLSLILALAEDPLGANQLQVEFKEYVEESDDHHGYETLMLENGLRKIG